MLSFSSDGSAVSAQPEILLYVPTPFPVGKDVREVAKRDAACEKSCSRCFLELSRDSEADYNLLSF